MSGDRLSRSPLLMDRSESVVLVVDLQERLVAAQPEGERIVWNSRRLLDAAAALGVSCSGTEQVPAKLGPTVAALAARIPAAVAKSAFSAAACDELVDFWSDVGVRHVVIAGIETHVCVAQTALDLLAAGFEPRVVVDAVGSRFAVDHETALRRLEGAGVVLTTTEAAMFEWCERADDDAFRAVSALAKESQPTT